jgi:hypothetical protein
VERTIIYPVSGVAIRALFVYLFPIFFPFLSFTGRAFEILFRLLTFFNFLAEMHGFANKLKGPLIGNVSIFGDITGGKKDEGAREDGSKAKSAEFAESLRVLVPEWLKGTGKEEL